jgi:hypothetical protein
MSNVAIHPRFPMYRVHDDGRVISMVNRNERTLSPIRMGNYRGLQLVDADGALRKVYLHRLVLEAFVGAPPVGQEARHLDGDRTNNAASNLAWGSRSENMRDKERHGTAPRGERHPSAKLTDEIVLRMREMHAAGVSITTLCREFSVSRMTCWRAATGASWAHL